MASSPNTYKILVGTGSYDFLPLHPTAPQVSTNIFTLEFNATDNHLKAVSCFPQAGANPTWVSVSDDRKLVLSVNEVGTPEGRLATFAMDPASGTIERPINQKGSGGLSPCHASFSASGKTAFVANYGGGIVRAFAVQEDGSLDQMTSELTFDDHTNIELPDQAACRAHCVMRHPSAAGLIYVADLGADAIRILQVDGGGKLVVKKSVKTEPASGPRQLAFHPSGQYLYVVYELDCTARVGVFEIDLPSGDLAHLQTLDMRDPDTIAAITQDPRCKMSGAAVRVSDDGKFLYATVRGDFKHEDGDCITVCAIDTKADQQHLQRVQHARAPQGGWHLRDLAISKDGRFVVSGSMANGGEVTLFSRDESSGKLDFVTRLTLKDDQNRVISPANFVWL